MTQAQARLLVVDDSDSNRDMLSRRLSRLGHEVTGAANGVEALQLMRSQDFDVVLLDIMMPEMDGYQVLEHLREDVKLRHIPVIVVSAVDDVESVVRCIELGAEDYLPKPFNSVLLKARVNASLEKKLLRDQEQAYLSAIKREMALGRQIQSDFLPETLPQPHGWQLAVFFKPAYEVAGDFYDVFQLPDDRLGLLVADVSGKGVGAAIFMALNRSLIRAFVEQNVDTADNILKAIPLTNEYIIRHHQRRADMFATLFFGVLDTESGLLTYINAGHFPPILIRSIGEHEWLNPTGPLVGITADIPYEIKSTYIEEGDIMLAYTDGIIEAADSEGDLFGMEGLLSAVEHAAPSADASLVSIEATVRAYVGDEPFTDDATMLAVRRRQDSTMIIKPS